MIIGAIDVGSNSVKLLVGRRDDARFRTLARRTAVTRLSRGLAKTGRISRESASETLKVLAGYKRICDELKCDKVVAVGTEALRRAVNGPDFARRCEAEAGFMIKIITGGEEARLSFIGATSDYDGESVVAIDIGGASTEIMIGKPGQLYAATSIPMGAVSLTEAHLPSDPPGPTELREMRDAIHANLETMAQAIRRKASEEPCLVGVGGTCVNIGSIYANRRSPRQELHGMRLPLNIIKSIHDRLASLTLEKRKKVVGLQPERADIIVAGGAILLGALFHLEIPYLAVSVHGLRKGLILETTDA